MASLFENIEDYASTSDRIKEQLNKKACEAIEAEKLKVCEDMFKEEDEEVVESEENEEEVKESEEDNLIEESANIPIAIKKL